jgi:glucokinase
MSEESLARSLDLPSVHLINDLEATAYGIGELTPEQLYTLNEGDGERDGHRGLIAAGTGLGMAAIYFDGAGYHPMPSEGGHIDFAPRDEREFEMLSYLREKIGGRVSYERVLSGMGLFNIYSFLRDRGHGEEPAWLAEEIRSGDPSAAISRAALAGKSELAETTLQMFVEIYGAMAGNLALLLKSVGGLYIGGGIAPKIMEKLKDGAFMHHYGDKGRMSGLVKSIPVRVILDDKTALYGAARYALSTD